MSDTRRDARGRWPRGVSGCPKGRPPKPLSLTAQLREVLGEIVTGAGGEPRTRARVVAEKVVKLAEEGISWAAELCWDRLEGRPRLTVEVEGDGDLPHVIFSPLRIPGPLLPQENGADDAEAQ